MTEDGEFQVIYREQVVSLAGSGPWRTSDGSDDEDDEDDEPVERRPEATQPGDSTPVRVGPADRPGRPRSREGWSGSSAAAGRSRCAPTRGARRYHEWVFLYAPTETPAVPQAGR